MYCSVQSHYWVITSNNETISITRQGRNIPELLLSNTFAHKTHSHGNNFSNNKTNVFSVGPSRDVITKTCLEVSSVGREPPIREDLSMEAEEQPLLEPLPRND
jgi:hypothetical protein